MRQIVVSNETSVCGDAEAASVVDAVNTQLSRDLGPLWKTAVRLVFSKDPAPAHVERIHLLDNSDVADALGYHEVDFLVPAGFVFVKTDKDAGERWSRSSTHVQQGGYGARVETA